MTVALSWQDRPIFASRTRVFHHTRHLNILTCVLSSRSHDTKRERVHVYQIDQCSVSLHSVYSFLPRPQNAALVFAFPAVLQAHSGSFMACLKGDKWFLSWVRSLKVEEKKISRASKWIGLAAAWIQTNKLNMTSVRQPERKLKHT